MGQPTFSARYRAAEAQSGGSCPIEAGLLGRLPFDRTPSCGCWPQEGAGVFALPARPLQRRADRRAACHNQCPPNESRTSNWPTRHRLSCSNS